ncbi:MAG: hypothetical protein RI571_07890 [Roseovarius sp.]|nr:hypothetical protein [Roseovarius sp.]
MSIRASAIVATLGIALTCTENAAFAAHGNPWADEDDTVNARYHDTNLEKSVDTPGEDEMNGALSRNAHGKSDSSQGQSGAAGGNGGGGNGGGGRN